jgi:CarD family transcriptional regulator
MPKTDDYGFKIGELAVYPAHGVGVIESIWNQKCAGETQAFYVLRILDSDATFMVPIKNVPAVGMRKIMKKSMLPKVYSVLKSKTGVSMDSQTWNRRYREYNEKIKTGCILEVAKVMRDLHILKGSKDLSFGERRMLDAARNLLVKELSAVKKTKQENIEKELDMILKR